MSLLSNSSIPPLPLSLSLPSLSLLALLSTRTARCAAAAAAAPFSTIEPFHVVVVRYYWAFFLCLGRASWKQQQQPFAPNLFLTQKAFCSYFRAYCSKLLTMTTTHLYVGPTAAVGKLLAAVPCSTHLSQHWICIGS